LRVPIASGKFHGDRKDRADRLFHGQQPGTTGGSKSVAAGDPDGFLREPTEELGPVADLAGCLGKWFTHLQCHQQRDVSGSLRQQVERPAQDLRALPGVGGPPVGRGGDGGVQRLDAVFGCGVGDLGDDLAGRWVLDGEHRPGRNPLPADQQPLRDSVQHPTDLLIRHHCVCSFPRSSVSVGVRTPDC